ncbi:15930_t:CDS:2 [Entrophospora sp. SA101]|nr:10768_t:CDS:2 [Entrophospora sp. SA101]CAJ0627812.1 7052_t:CDS:2 [Entrophospora sp. SA101]CAJ0754294.1 15930_t:CDS:2 [Entrophospora sp. SA101]CAJ0841106.1 9647_t:CDS:2 [Entrophospora sp. SA101]CAJ0844505.1 9863_t:CDS:2 [Entrophospora sp. SA101]
MSITWSRQSGVGKSTLCENLPDSFWEWAIFYGFYGWLSYDFILRLLDKTPLTVEIKSGI